MKKADRLKRDSVLSKALQPPPPRDPAARQGKLDAILEEYADPEGIPSAIPTPIPASIPDTIPDTTPAGIPKRQERAEVFTPLDATHTASEKGVYSIMYRETVSKGQSERRFGPAELMAKTGIRSRNTVHKALYGLLAKLSIEVTEEANGNPLGPRYRVYKPQEVEQRRRQAGIVIDPQSKQIIGIPQGIPTTIPAGVPDAIAKDGDTSGDSTLPNSGIVIKEDQIKELKPDDEAFAALVSELSAACREVTGRDVSPREAERWAAVGRFLAGVLRAAAGRTTNPVNSAAGLLASDLAAHYASRRAPEKRATGANTAQETPPDEPLSPELERLREQLAESFPHLVEGKPPA